MKKKDLKVFLVFPDADSNKNRKKMQVCSKKRLTAGEFI